MEMLTRAVNEHPWTLSYVMAVFTLELLLLLIGAVT